MASTNNKEQTFKGSTSELIEAALDTMAEIIIKHGDVYVPIYERLERERDALLEKSAVAERIRRRTAAAHHEPAARA